jgi:hypothetical protein
LAYPTGTVPEPWNRLLELLGEWHDDQAVIEHLRKAVYLSRFNQAEGNMLTKVKDEMIVHREDLLAKIVATFFSIQNKESIDVDEKPLIAALH